MCASAALARPKEKNRSVGDAQCQRSDDRRSQKTARGDRSGSFSTNSGLELKDLMGSDGQAKNHAAVRVTSTRT